MNKIRWKEMAKQTTTITTYGTYPSFEKSTCDEWSNHRRGTSLSYCCKGTNFNGRLETPFKI